MPTDDVSAQRPLGLSIALVVGGAAGTLAALALMLEKIHLLENPDARLSCNLSVLVGCSTNLNSVQGSVFGFPNPLLGLMFWPGVVATGVALLAGARFAGWFWVLFSLAMTAALALVVWFVGQSVFVLGVLCPWCMATWAVTIPLFLAVLLHTLRSASLPVPRSVRAVAARGYGWIPLAALLCYVVIAVTAQSQLDVLHRL